MDDVQGTPIWFELTTTDGNAAKDFYAAVAGWRVQPSPMAEHGGYLIATAGDDNGVAGIMTPPTGMDAPGGWTIYFAVDDVDTAAARVAQLGGTTAFGPMDIPHVGRFAVIADPQGVTCALMKRSTPDALAAFAQVPGALGYGVWIELATPDPDGAFAFYGALFGWEKAGAMPMGDMGDYAFIGRGEDFRPGAVMPSVATGAPARWNWYVNVADIDAAIATAQARGGTLMQGPDQIPDGDYSANLADPAGHQFGVVGPRKET